MHSKTSNTRAHVVVSGSVQGVFFRAHMREKADELGVTGWVKNRWDGKVEAVCEGPKDSVDKLISWCHKGPPYAVVGSVDIEWEKYSGEFGSFSIAF